METEYNGYMHTSTMTAIFEDGKWRVTHLLVQRHSTDLKEWEEKAVEASSESESLDKATAEVVLTVQTYLNKVKGNLFTGDLVNDNSDGKDTKTEE